MKSRRTIVMTSLLTALVLFLSIASRAEIPPTRQLISEISLLIGLAPRALFPFIDSTPHSVGLAHIAITDATSSCTPGAAAPTNVQVLAGVAGGTLVNVMTAGTNTGIGSS